jgi:hypothetical protein
MNTIHSPAVLNSSAAASWLPVCLPKFNPAGFVNAYVHFLGADDPAFAAPPTEAAAPPDPAQTHGLALVCVSAGGDFDAIRAWGDGVAARLAGDGIVRALAAHVRGGGAAYAVGAVGAPGLRHFAYKSRAHVQLTAPAWEEPYEREDDRRRVVTLYQRLHDAVHARSGQAGGLKLMYVRTDKESVMGWVRWVHAGAQAAGLTHATDHAAVRAVPHALTARAEERGGERGERDRALGQEGGGASVPAGRAGVLSALWVRLARCCGPGLTRMWAGCMLHMQCGYLRLAIASR